VLVTALSEVDDRIHGLEAGADDFLTKPVNVHELEARVRSLLRIKRYTDELDSAEAVILSLALTVEARDAYTQGHCARLAAYGVALGQALGLDGEDLAALRRGGYLHDIGKIAVPDAVLLKPGPLTEAEREVVKRHPVIGDELCGRLRLLANVRPIVRHHHECLDGSGYPDALRGQDVPLLAQIVSVVDLFDAMTTDRPYRRARSPQQACGELRNEVARNRKRADVVDAFVDLVDAGRLPRPASDLA
jgi:putative two-component system response regulator